MRANTPINGVSRDHRAPWPTRLPTPHAPSRGKVGDKFLTYFVLTPLVDGGNGQPCPVMEWLTTFHLASVVLDPYTNESSWILRAASRVLEQFLWLRCTHQSDRHRWPRSRGARSSVRSPTGSSCSATPLVRPSRQSASDQLPAFVFNSGRRGRRCGRRGLESARVGSGLADAIAAVTWWTSIPVPGPGDPGPFRGSPSLCCHRAQRAIALLRAFGTFLLSEARGEVRKAENDDPAACRATVPRGVRAGRPWSCRRPGGATSTARRWSRSAVRTSSSASTTGRSGRPGWSRDGPRGTGSAERGRAVERPWVTWGWAPGSS